MTWGLQPAQKAAGLMVSAVSHPRPAQKQLERGGQAAEAGEQSCVHAAKGLRGRPYHPAPQHRAWVSFSTWTSS